MVTANGDSGPSSANDLSKSVPLKDLESGTSENAQEPDRSDNSLDLAEDEVGQGLLGGRSNRHTYSSDVSQNSARFRWCSTFLKGPDPPRKHRIKPFFETFQTAPIRMIERLIPNSRLRVVTLIAIHALWATLFLAILNWSMVGPEIPGYGMPNRLSCGARLW